MERKKPVLLIDPKRRLKNGRPAMLAVRLTQNVLDRLAQERPDILVVDLPHWPSEEEITEALYDGACYSVKCGCPVEPDGYCEHGYPSWLVALNII